jgi:ParB family chromosome partitioning protein
MAQTSKSLGRGLQSPLGAQPTVSASRGAGTLPISLMQPGAFQPRREIHQQPLEELAASIKANGVIEPIVLRALPAETVGVARYEIVAGERRVSPTYRPSSVSSPTKKPLQLRSSKTSSARI